MFEQMTKEEAIVVLKNEQPHCGKKALFSEEKKYMSPHMVGWDWA